MKTLIFLLFPISIFAQDLANPIQNSLYSNVKYGNGIQIEDTLLAKGLLYFSSGATNGYVLTSNADGIATWQQLGATLGDSSLWKIGGGTTSLMDKRSKTNSGNYGTTIGYDASNTKLNGFSIGHYATNSGIEGLALGDTAENSGLRGLAIGNSSNNLSTVGMSIGNNATNSGAFGIAFGDSSVNAYGASIGLGAYAITTAYGQLMISDSITHIVQKNIVTDTSSLEQGGFYIYLSSDGNWTLGWKHD